MRNYGKLHCETRRSASSDSPNTSRCGAPQTSKWHSTSASLLSLQMTIVRVSTVVGEHLTRVRCVYSRKTEVELHRAGCGSIGDSQEAKQDPQVKAPLVGAVPSEAVVRVREGEGWRGTP